MNSASSVFALSLAAAFASTLHAADVKLTEISTLFNSPIGIDYHEPTDSVIVSVNYLTGGTPNNFERILLNGSHVPFSVASGLADEVKMATARSGNPGFAAGTLFTGNGSDGEIARISPDGLTVNSTWVSLPGAGNGLMRGSLYVDRGGAWGGDLVAVTTGGEIWRVDSLGNPSFIADVDAHLEGLITLPNNVVKYGPLAGKAIAGAEGLGLMYAFGTDGSIDTYSFGINIEDIDIIEAGANFFGVNFGSSRILGAEAAQFTSMVDDILLTQEIGFSVSGLYRLYWNGSSLVTEELGLTFDSENPAQWEHVTFAPAGILEISDPVPEPATVWGAAGLAALAAWKRRRSLPA